MAGYCRGCCKKFEDPMDLLQYNEERRRLFVYSTGLQVKRNDVFTFQLCKECYLSMKTSCRFKKMCRTSDRKIKNFLTLKDVDDGMDFGSYIKRNEESLTFRLPMLSGVCTPVNHKTKDDDNESTCTSIQNFMTDILSADEIPDSEARIIKEVIEEEADVLEDSLDSHWLEDDFGNEEFRLDLSLSRFSTPKSVNHDGMSSPEYRDVTSTDITSGEDYDNIPIDVTLKKLSDPVNNTHVINNLYEMEVQNDTAKVKCVIDKNLEKALRDENNQEFSLQEILASPVFPSKSGASTPTIKHIIFGDKDKKYKKTKSPKFEPDLDLLLGKLDKSTKKQEELRRGKIDFEIGISKVPEKRKELGKKNNMKLQKRQIDLEKFSAGKVLQEKLVLSKGRLKEEKELFRGKFGKDYEDKFNLNILKIGVIEKVHQNLDNFDAGNANDGKQDMNVDILVEGNDRNVVPVNNNNARGLQFDIFREPFNDIFDEDSDDGILEEFLNAEKEKLANVEMKRKAVNSLVNAAQIDDAELTELLQKAYDNNINIIKDKKLIFSHCPLNGDKLSKELVSPIEHKYCVTNFYCKMCNIKFKNLTALKIHFTKCHKYKINTPKGHWIVKIKMCDLCGKTFTNNKSLIRHIQNHNKPKQYTCDKCSLTFKAEHLLKNHKKTHMGPEAEKQQRKLNIPYWKYVCKFCGFISSSSSNHITHERRHTKVYTLHCEDCGMGFYRNSDLVCHRRQHTGERPFACLYCAESFSRRDTLNRHIKRHTDEKKYKCEYCNQKFTKSYDVKTHQKHNKNCLKLRDA